MSKIKSAVLLVDCFDAKAGAMVRVREWTMIEREEVRCSESDIRTLAAHGIVEIEEEEQDRSCETCIYGEGRATAQCFLCANEPDPVDSKPAAPVEWTNYSTIDAGTYAVIKDRIERLERQVAESEGKK
jgi:hypothetical protein